MSDDVTPIREAAMAAEEVTVDPVTDDAAPPQQVKKKKPRGGQLLPKDCPVTALGIGGNDFYYLDVSRQLKVLRPSDHSRLGVLALFGRRNDYLYDKWPRFSKDGELVGWTPDKVAENLMAAADAAGVIDVTETVRGPGAWRDQDGGLVIHCGDAIYSGGQTLPPGSIGRYIYPAAAEKPKPAPLKAGTDAAEELLSLLKTWNWRRPEIDPYLLLGWIGAALIGGALKWRPCVWITGDKSTGKSTLQDDVVGAIFGPGGIVKTPDGTAASLWQKLGHASLPCDLDELEAEEDNRRNAAIIKLARVAASGGELMRGGSDHKGASFTLRSCFMFSSILIPPLQPQDASRIAILNLDSLEGATAPSFNLRRLTEIGAQLRRRLMDGWGRLEDTLFAYRAALADAGHGGRGADVFGTLLACADLLMYDSLPSTDELEGWGERLKKSTLAEAEDDVADHEKCVAHILTSLCDVYRNGEKRQIGAWIAAAAGRNKSGAVDPEANRVLASFGIKVGADKAGKDYLYIANAHQGTAKLFSETHWNGRSGTTGVWVQALRRVPGSQPGGCIRFDGVPSRCTMIPIEHVLPEEEEA